MPVRRGGARGRGGRRPAGVPDNASGRARVARIVEVAPAAVVVAAVVFVMNGDGRFHRRHLLAEARRHLALVLRARRRDPGLDDQARARPPPRLRPSWVHVSHAGAIPRQRHGLKATVGRLVRHRVFAVSGHLALDLEHPSQPRSSKPAPEVGVGAVAGPRPGRRAAAQWRRVRRACPGRAATWAGYGRCQVRAGQRRRWPGHVRGGWHDVEGCSGITDGELRVAPKAPPESRMSVWVFGTMLSVRGSESVLDATLRAGLDVPYSCREGICGTCRAKVTCGDVHHDPERPRARRGGTRLRPRLPHPPRVGRSWRHVGPRPQPIADHTWSWLTAPATTADCAPYPEAWPRGMENTGRETRGTRPHRDSLGVVRGRRDEGDAL